VTAKYAAMAAALLIITGLPLVVLYLGGLLAGLPFGRQTAEFAGGLLGVLVLSLLLAGIGLVFAALTPRRGFAVAIIIVVLLVSYGAVNIVAAVAWEEGNFDLAGWVGLFSPITLFDGAQVWLFEAESSAVVEPPGTLGGVVYSLVTLACIAGTYGILLARYRRLAAA
jgi:ABC-2 type transport system permease protein